MFIEAPEEGSSSCRSADPKGELIERTYDCIILGRSLRGQNKNMEVVEGFESRPHKAVNFFGRRRQGYPGSGVEKKTMRMEGEGIRVEQKVTKAVLVVDAVHSTIS